MKITVAGAGAWGTALAVHVARDAQATSHQVCLWARDPQQAALMRQSRRNDRYLPGTELPAPLHITSDWQEAVGHVAGAAEAHGLMVIATPMAALSEMLRQTPDHLSVLWLCKGFEKETGRLGHEVAANVRPTGLAGVLSGPSFAQEVALGLPTALVAACTSATLGQQAIEAFHHGHLRVYRSDDPVGVEVGGAVKNVLAIATGVCDGLGLGLNARAALITRGLAEMSRLGVALGARAETFMGLSGLGDLVLTATGDLSRNRQVGLKLAQNLPLASILQALGHVSEGVYSAKTVLTRAQSLGVDMPITQAVVGLLQGDLSAQEAVQQLMLRGARTEH